jgi:hypothetical protein
MRRALLIGINYIGTPNQLYGCINDINNIGVYLSVDRKYNSFIVLTDYTSRKPTRANILSAFAELLKGAVAGDELWLHYSGHGNLMRDTNGDEESGQDSCICPLDFARSGFITDDLIRNNLALLVPKGVRLYIILDACHSGTGCDLRYKYDDASYLTNKKAPLPEIYVPSDWTLQQTNYEYKRYAKTNGDVFCISGCQDNQTSADAYIDRQATGALSYILLKCLRNNPSITYKWKHLLKDICCGEKINGFEQRTAITSGNPLNMEDNVFVTLPASAAAAQAPTPVVTKRVISMARNLNYNPKIKKLYIKF